VRLVKCICTTFRQTTAGIECKQKFTV